MVFQTGMKWYLIVVFFCIYLISNDIEYFFMWLLAAYIYIFFCEMSDQVFIHFLLIDLFVFLLLNDLHPSLLGLDLIVALL